MKKSKTAAKNEMLEVLLQLVTTYPPEGFKSAFVYLLLCSGRWDEATSYIKTYMEERAND